MYSSSLNPLQMIGVSLSAIARTASSSGFDPASRPKLIRTAEFEYLFDHLPLLVYLDGKNAAIAALISVFAHRRIERLVHFAKPVLENIAEPDQNGQRDAAPLERVDQLF